MAEIISTIPVREHPLKIVKPKERILIPKERRPNLGMVEMDKRSPEAIKAKKIQEKELPAWWQEKAVFLASTEEFFRNCGLDPTYINPIPIGEGLTNVVFSYEVPNQPKQVIKVAREARKGFMSQGIADDAENIALVKKYFGSHAVPTEIRTDPTTHRSLVVQEAILGKAVTNIIETQDIRAQLADLARLNREMMRQTGHSLDFIGMPGFLSWFGHQFRRILTNKSEFQLSNIVVDETGMLRIIDEGLLRFGNGLTPKQRLGSASGFLANRLIMRLYFGVDLQPELQTDVVE